MTFRPFHQEGDLYFITASISGWKCLFHESQYADIILGSLDFLRESKRHYLYSFVVMPNHAHFINKPREGFTISDIIQNFGSFTAHQILKQLRKENRQDLLDYFQREAIALQARTLGGAEAVGMLEEVQMATAFKGARCDLPLTHASSHAGIISTCPRVRTGTRHKIWQDIQAKNIFSIEVLEQKMEYTHSNPCNKNWHLVKDRSDYKYSSACFYDKGIKPIIEIDDVRDLYR